MIRGLGSSFEGRYRSRARREIENRINRLLALQPDQVPIISLEPGQINVAVCKRCP